MGTLFGMENIWTENLLVCERPFTDSHRKVSSAGQLQKRSHSGQSCLWLDSRGERRSQTPVQQKHSLDLVLRVGALGGPAGLHLQEHI